MTTVIVAVVGALATLLAGVVPVLVVSERRRLLRVAKDEWDLVKEVDDEETEQHLRAAMRYTALRYTALRYTARSRP